MKRQNSQQLAARRREVVSLTHKGWTQAAIASHLNIPQGTVSRDLAAMRGFWRDFPVYDFENVRIEQLQKNRPDRGRSLGRLAPAPVRSRPRHPTCP